MIDAREVTDSRLCRRKSRNVHYLIIMIVLVILVGICSISLGSYAMTPIEVARTLFAATGADGMMQKIVFDIRLPRILLAILSGMAMALSGVVLQVLTRNALAAPGLIGVEAGAGTAVLLAMIVWRSSLPVELYPVAAFVGGVSVALLVAALAWNRSLAPLRLILVGVGITAILAAVADTLITYGRIGEVGSALLWLAGSLHRADWANVRSQALWLMISGIPVLLLSRHFDLFQLGNAVAASRGLDTAKLRIAALFLSVMLTASAVANVGTMSFIGLLAPHAARLLVGDRHHLLLPLAAMIGAAIVLVSDTIGRTIFAPLQLPAGLVVAVISAPYILYLLSRNGASR